LEAVVIDLGRKRLQFYIIKHVLS